MPSDNQQNRDRIARACGWTYEKNDHLSRNPDRMIWRHAKGGWMPTHPFPAGDANVALAAFGEVLKGMKWGKTAHTGVFYARDVVSTSVIAEVPDTGDFAHDLYALIGKALDAKENDNASR